MRQAGLRFAGILGGKYRRAPQAAWWHRFTDIGSLLLNLRDILLIAIGSVQSLWLLGRFRPDAVFNKGGSVGLPVGLACRLLRIPMVIHEPDIIPGLGNKLLARWATAIAVGFPPELYPQLPAAKLSYTGNPVRPEVVAGEQAPFSLSTDRPVVAIVGGSQGAARINAAVVAILPELLKIAQVVHVTGAHDRDHTAKAVANLHLPDPSGYQAVEFLPIAELGGLYRAATLVVARAGANTIAELAALGKPAIILPNHQAAAHQIANARWLAQASAAVVLADEQPQPLLAAITELLASPAHLQALSTHIAACNTPNAAERLADLILQAAAQ